MDLHPMAGKQAPKSLLTNIPRLVSAYYTGEPRGPVKFGTSGHRGSSLEGTFNEKHIAATAQAICEYRNHSRISGPLFLGFDTHALSEPAFRTALEVFAGNGVEVIIHAHDAYTPTPVISFWILRHNASQTRGVSDGVVITPSHNPPWDGGFKYNPPHGGPADTEATSWIEKRANRLTESSHSKIRRIPYDKARRVETTRHEDLMNPFVDALSQVIDMESVRDAGIRIGTDPMGGSGIHFWDAIAERHGLNIEVVNRSVDPTFRFMRVDSDGVIRMDCSSSYAMSGLIAEAEQFDIAWGNDPDFDRHGIVTGRGLMNPNHFLSVAIWYLLQHRPGWREDLAVGKTLVSSGMIDRVVAALGKPLYEVPVGFKWFVEGLLEGSLAFCGEESAGATLLRMDGTAWTTDKDGFSPSLLAAEIVARTGKSPDEIYRDELVPRFGETFYKRADRPITDRERSALNRLQPEAFEGVRIDDIRINEVMMTAPGNSAPIGGVKAVLEDGSWFAVRPSGTEEKLKVYIESYGGETLWNRIYEQVEALFR